MSRIGKLPISVPKGVTVTVDESNLVVVKGPKGTLSQDVNKDISISQGGGVLHLTTRTIPSPKSRCGLYRTLVNNMIIGVTKGWQDAGAGGHRLRARWTATS